MSIDIIYQEDKESLLQDSNQLKCWLKDIEALTHINEFTDEDLFIQKYLERHKYLSIEELESRLVEIHNLLYMAKNLN